MISKIATHTFFVKKFSLKKNNVKMLISVLTWYQSQLFLPKRARGSIAIEV